MQYLNDKAQEIYSQIYSLWGDEQTISALKEVEKLLDQNPLLLPHLLTLCSLRLSQFQKKAKQANDHLMREALGDAVHLLGMNKKPKASFITQMSARIKSAIFPNGITSHHHQGEKQFFEKYLKDDVQ